MYYALCHKVKHNNRESQIINQLIFFYIDINIFGI